MRPESRQSTRDLRSNAVVRKREAKTKAKWYPEWSRSTGIPASKTDSSGTVHPKPFHSQGCQRGDRRSNAKEIYKAHVLKKQHPLGDETESRFRCLDRHPHYSEDESSSGYNSPPTGDDGGDAGILYSYDAAKGPASGKQVFNQALTKAVKDFEDGQTTKLVNDQYEVIQNESEGDDGPSTTTAEDDDYEMV